jgi:hypothetical protein
MAVLDALESLNSPRTLPALQRLSARDFDSRVKRRLKVHFHKGEPFAKTHAWPFAKGDVGTTVPAGFLRRRKALRLKPLGLGPKIRMPMGDVLTDHHSGILGDRIAAKRIGIANAMFQQR